MGTGMAYNKGGKMLNKFIEFAREQRGKWSDRVEVRGRRRIAIFGDRAFDVTRFSEGRDPSPSGRGKVTGVYVAVKGRYYMTEQGVMGFYVFRNCGRVEVSAPTFVVVDKGVKGEY
jgi:hypothetical protein